jgi:hypothetical protein
MLFLAPRNHDARLLAGVSHWVESGITAMPTTQATG